jgi:hypothetical protein
MKKRKGYQVGPFTGLFLASLASSITAVASDAAGDLFYTKFSGTPNVWKVPFTFDDATDTAALGTPVPLASAPGADGIIFAPSGNLLIGGQGANKVFEYTTGGVFVSEGSALGNSFHLALDPSGKKVWTSGFSADLADLPLSPNVGSATPPLHDVTGDDGGVTQLAFAPSGKTFYVNGLPNGDGNLGEIDMTTFVTTRFASSVEPAHGMVYDSFTGLMTLFGHGHAGSFDPDDPSATLLVSDPLWTDFDQGAVDGKGHALVAGGNAITFIDYSTSGDITKPDFVKNFSGSDFINIDDVAPLSGLGSTPTLPDGGSTAILLLLGSGVVCFGRRARA